MLLRAAVLCTAAENKLRWSSLVLVEDLAEMLFEDVLCLLDKIHHHLNAFDFALLKCSPLEFKAGLPKSDNLYRVYLAKRHAPISMVGNNLGKSLSLQSVAVTAHS